jgi:hypothetical protein
MSYKVLTRSPLHDKSPYRTHTSHDTLGEAMAVAARLEKNLELDVCVELPSNQVVQVPFNVLALED